MDNQTRIYPVLARWIKRNYDVSSESVKFVLRDMVDQLCQDLHKIDEDFPQETFVKYCGIK